ncbi:16S rRNA (cytidine(1402)-2'-O)-methyltransferase [Aliikangiella marina]|uniref:Ribosomal RNA small subunit methyltransferase I n=1 Tax=Aliikangiella marina TaxID=1712262 RepID=A0A545T6P1_9GAMM|nr:16S rRNA (cytidine(1402)-2'-O)-methyltransferase [Aliikangiella marina]TQV72842.1 16S rRNA (cytidine(1402)-2'-O)-methyltransferase [Aliikangiella marina]
MNVPSKDKQLRTSEKTLKEFEQNTDNSGYGCLYVVATPIGNLDDISDRMRQTLAKVSKIAAEDTRRTRQLLSHIGVDTPCFSLHDHNERQKLDSIVHQLKSGESIALVSDAGTPLISDPGYPLVARLRAESIKVIPIPGPCALIAALSVAGLPSDRFIFEGFLAAKPKARQLTLERLKEETATLIFYESSHRIKASLADMAKVFGPERRVVIARELTKTFETLLDASLSDLITRLDVDANQSKGEFVVMVKGAEKNKLCISPEAIKLAELLTDYLPGKQAAKIAAEFFGEKKNQLYNHLLDQK